MHIAPAYQQLVPAGFYSHFPSGKCFHTADFFARPTNQQPQANLIPPMLSPQSTHTLPSRLTVLSGLLSLLLLPSALFGQGCVIARGGGGAMLADGSGYLEPGEWQLTTAYRYFKSHRHFAGDDEQKQRSVQGTEVYNTSNFLDVTANYAWTKRLNLRVTLPFVHFDRSSMYEHLGNSSGQRFSTQAAGLGDVNIGATWWVFDPNRDNPRGNVSVGFGVKLPTGNAEVRDIFVKSTGPALKYVDSSIQPGDGGTGATVDLQGFLRLTHNFSLYGNGFYLVNPEERNENTGFSIPDSYMVRGGLDYRIDAIKGLSVSLGLRNEGVVAHDLFGGSRGSRRPGFAVAVEPGFSYSRGKFACTVAVPVAIHRNRTTTFGSIKAGDAAFADWTLNTSFSIRL